MDVTEKKESLVRTEVVFILDRSGSMSGLESDTIGGFNSTLKEQKSMDGDVVWTTVLFDNKVEILHNRVSIKDVSPITEKEYFVRGSTALLDAVGQTICSIKVSQNLDETDKKIEKTLFVITTDGMENASNEYSYDKVKQLIEKQKKKGWEFLFLGANIDAVSVAGKMGIDADRAASFINDSVGIETNYKTTSRALKSLRKGAALSEDILDEVSDYYNRKK